MTHGIVNVPDPVNEPVLSYAPGSAERASLQDRLESMLAERIEIPVIIGGNTRIFSECGSKIGNDLSSCGFAFGAV